MKQNKFLATILAGTTLAGMAVTGFAPEASAEIFFNDGDTLSLGGDGFIFALDTDLPNQVATPIFCDMPIVGTTLTFGPAGQSVPCAAPDGSSALIDVSSIVTPADSGFVPFANADVPPGMARIFSTDFNGNFTVPPGGLGDLSPFTPLDTPSLFFTLTNAGGDVLDFELTTLPFDPAPGTGGFLNLTADGLITRTDTDGRTQTVDAFFEFSSQFIALPGSDNIGGSEPPYDLATPARSYSLTVTVNKSVPEPGTMAGLAFVASLGAGKLLSNKKKNLH